jgi:hypothetical protein
MQVIILNLLLIEICSYLSVRKIRLVLATNPTFPKSRVCVLTDMEIAIQYALAHLNFEQQELGNLTLAKIIITN